MPRNAATLTLFSAGICSLGLSAGLANISVSAQEISPRFGVDFNTPRNGDDDRVFGQVSAFFPLSQTLENNLTFLSTSGRVNSTGNFGGSVSLGHRLALDERTILGGYLAYDARDTGRRTFSQVGLGAELLGENWSASVNGYVPVGTTSAQVGGATGAGQATTASFQGSQLLLNTSGSQQAFESVLGGVDVGVGVKLGDFGEYGNLWGTGTAYYLADTLGGSLQLDHRLDNRFRFGAGVQSDGIFGTQAFLSVGASIGGSRVETTDDDRMPWAQVAGRDIRRNSRVVVQSQTRNVGTSETTVAVNPRTGQAYRIRHVVPDSANANQGDGTPESPFTTLGTDITSSSTALSGAGSSDVVYVRAGDSRTNPLDSFTIPAGVQVYSDAADAMLSTQLGEVALPGSGTGLRPLVDAAGTNGIMLAGNNSLLSGFEVENATNGIFTSGFTGTVIQNNVVSSNSEIGIFVDNSPSAVVQDNTVNNNSKGGLLLRASNNVMVQNNTVNNNSGFGITLAELSNATVQGNQLNDSQTVDFSDPLLSPAAIRLAEVTGMVAVSSNTVERTTLGPTVAPLDALEGQGIGLVNTRGALSLTVDNNTVSRNVGDGIVIGLAANAEASVTITNNTIESNGGTGPVRGDGIKIAGEDSSAITQLRIENNRINDNIDDGIDISLNQVRPPSATINNAVIRGNTVNGSANGQGIILRSNQGGSMQIAVQDNTLNGNASDGLRAESRDNAQICVALTGNSSDGGFQLSQGGSSSFAVVDLSAIATSNAGSLAFAPDSTSFTSVNSLSDCSNSLNP